MKLPNTDTDLVTYLTVVNWLLEHHVAQLVTVLCTILRVLKHSSLIHQVWRLSFHVVLFNARAFCSHASEIQIHVFSLSQRSYIVKLLSMFQSRIIQSISQRLKLCKRVLTLPLWLGAHNVMLLKKLLRSFNNSIISRVKLLIWERLLHGITKRFAM